MGAKCYVAVIISIFTIVLPGCKHEPQIIEPEYTGDFPAEIGTIIETKCATDGCHNAASYKAAGGLLLDSWGHLFDGGNTGAVVIPYSTAHSSLLYFINPDSALGIVAEPRMPLYAAPLSKEEYITIRDWIAKGAPDKNGTVPFSTQAESRQKVYAIHQGCDEVAVIDAAKNVVMRYIPIGSKPYPEGATHIRVSPDGRYAYAAMWYDRSVYKIDTYTDQVVSTINMGELFWNVLHSSSDGQKMLVTNGDNYDMLQINTASLQTQKLTNNDFINPHGIASNKSFDTFFVTSLFGNTIYKFSAGYNKKISIDGQPQTTMAGATPDPYDVIMSPDYSKYFVACEKSNELRILDAYIDALIKVIPVGMQPRTMALSKSKPYLFLCCMEDNSAAAGSRGSVYVINYNTLEIEKKIQGKFFQPHTVAVNDRDNTFYIFSRNQNYNGPAPHHQGPCSGRNGFYSVYDLSSLEPVNGRRYEVLVDPYISDIRFK
jgi:YVTN family beta-propeller protein